MRFKNPRYLLLPIIALVAVIVVVMYVTGAFDFLSENSVANKELDRSNGLAETGDEMTPDDNSNSGEEKAGVVDTINGLEDKEPGNVNEEEKTGIEGETQELGETDVEKTWLVENPVRITDNSPEFEVEMKLCYDNGNKAFVTLDYYNDGVSTSMELSSSNIPFLKQVEGHENFARSASQIIQEATLNSKLAKLYFFVRKAIDSSNEHFCLYVINLRDGSIKEIYIGEGSNISPISFSKDKKMAAFCYISNQGLSIPDYMLQILDCTSDRWYIVEGKTPLGNKIGQEGIPEKHYSYKMLSWKSDSEISLLEVSYLKTQQDISAITPEEIEVIYDVANNIIRYPEGYDSRGVKIVVEEKPEEPQDSPPMKALKRFYELVNNEEYNTAYDLLDEAFRLNAFKMFGSFELSKKDIDVEYFSEFATATGIFRSLQIKEIKKEETEGDFSKIYYIQSVNLEDGSSPIEMPLVATLSKVGEEWKITALDDWTERAGT